MNKARHWQVKETSPSHGTESKKQIVVKVKRRGWVSKGEKVIYSLFCAGLIASCLYVVSYASKTDHLNREVLQLEKTVHNQSLENEALYFEASELSSPERIIKIARENGLKIQDAKVKRATAVNK